MQQLYNFVCTNYRLENHQCDKHKSAHNMHLRYHAQAACKMRRTHQEEDQDTCN